MLFANCGQFAISTVFEGMELCVPVGGTVEIPGHMAADVARRGLPLEPVASDPPPAAPPQEEPKRAPGRPRKASNAS